MLLAYDETIAIIVDHATGLECTVKGAPLLAVLGTAGEEVEIKYKSDAATVKYKGGSMSLPALPADEFPFDFGAEEKSTVNMMITENFIKGLEFAIVGTNAESVQKALTGVTIDVGKNGYTLFASDNYTMTQFTSNAALKLNKSSLRVVVPRAACERIVETYKALKKDLDEKIGANITINSTHLTAKLLSKPTVTIISKLLDVDPTDFEPIMADASKKSKVIPLPEGTLATFERARIVSGNELVKRCLITPEDGRVVITASGQYGEVHDVLPAKGSPAGESYSVNPEHVLRILPSCTEVSFVGNSLMLKGEKLLYLVAHAVEIKE
jgi:DNA polymerase III sliding clamp (beta) subunit (PCNA family)